MSSSNSKTVSASIPVFTGTNYATWWPSMTAYLQSTGCMWIAKFTEPVLGESSTKDDRDFFIAWTKANDTIVGSIKNTFSDSFKLKHQAVLDAKTLLGLLGDEYAAPGIAGVYALFKELLDCKVTSSAHPEPSINKILTIYARLESALSSLMSLRPCSSWPSASIDECGHTNDCTEKGFGRQDCHPQGCRDQGSCDPVMGSTLDNGASALAAAGPEDQRCKAQGG